MSDYGPARPSDPDPSHEAGKRTDVLGKRARSFEVVCRMLACALPEAILSVLVLDLRGVPVLTRETLRWVCAQLEGKTEAKKETERRRLSDLMIEVYRKGKWTPKVHFDLLEPVLGADGKQLELNGFGQVRLTLKGQWWMDHPQVRDWRWPHHWDGIEIDMP